MDKHTSLDQLFDTTRNTPPVYSYTEAKQVVVNQTVTNSESILPTKQSFFKLAFWKVLVSVIVVMTASYFLFFSDSSLPAHPIKKQPLKEANTNKQPELISANVVADTTKASDDRIEPTHAEKGISPEPFKLFEAFIPANDWVNLSPVVTSTQLEVEKRDEPYIFPKLTEIEIKATQKQKKAMLKALEKMDKKKFAYIPSGEFEHNGKMTSVQSFVIQTTEVSNLEYRTFLFDLLMQNRKEEFLRGKPDQQQWNTLPGGLHSKMVEYYFSHPAYDNYPVVNISREGAEMYCVWLTEELEKVADEKKKSFYHPIRLPVRAEWVKATSIEVNKQPYPWNGPFMRNKDGLFLANFKQTPNEMAIQGSNKAYSTDVTAPVNAYFPNDYGAHNLSGNVAEMVYNDIQSKSAGTAGGGWMNSAEELKILGPDPYAGITSPHPCIGFRVVMTVTGGW